MQENQVLFRYTLLAALFTATGTLWGQQPGTAQVARGKYLVEGVGVCGDCHTAHNEKGEPDRARWLQGAPLDFQPIQPIPIFAKIAPPIAGLPAGWTEAEVAKFLQTGIGRDGKPRRPPMPPYRLNQADAAAVAAYLKSLQPASKPQ